MLKSVEKWLCKTRKYKTVAGHLELLRHAILKFSKKFDVFKSKVSNDLDKN
jgi:hypothetical protein